MLQRIQTLYLLIAVLLGAACTFLSFGSNEIYTINAYSVVDHEGLAIKDIWYFGSLIGITIVFALVDIFLYKNRELQLRIGKLMILLITVQVVLFAYLFTGITNENNEIIEFSVGVAPILLPIQALFVFLANKAIKKDEDLVKSVDRIR